MMAAKPGIAVSRGGANHVLQSTRRRLLPVNGRPLQRLSHITLGVAM